MAALGVRLVIVLNPALAAEDLQVIHREVIRKEVTSKEATSKERTRSQAINKEVTTAVVAINASRSPDRELASWFSASCCA